jgi:hypothetical protein
MKPSSRLLQLIACLVLLIGTVALAETLSNDSVIQMHKLGLGDSVVVEKIKASTCQFDTSLDALKSLKDAGLSDEVIQAMVAASTTVKSNVTSGNSNDPKVPHTSGIWLYQEIDGKPKMTQLNPSRVEELTTGSGWGMAWGGSMKTRAILANPHAGMQLKETQPVFYFYFAKTEQSLGSMDESATSPDDFALGMMEAHTVHDQPVRRIEISKASMGGYRTGLNKKDVRTFTTEKIGDGVFKVTPTALKSGEYVFVQLMGARVVSAIKMFDFGIVAGGDK